MSFAGQVVFITGGGSGMGRLAAQRMADAGAKVAAVDINEAGTLDSLVSVLRRTDNERGLLYALDMVSVVRAQRLVEPVTALFDHASGEFNHTKVARGYIPMRNGKKHAGVTRRIMIKDTKTCGNFFLGVRGLFDGLKRDNISDFFRVR